MDDKVIKKSLLTSNSSDFKLLSSTTLSLIIPIKFTITVKNGDPLLASPRNIIFE